MMHLVILLNVEVNRAITLIGKATFQYLLHQFLLFDDMSCSVGFNAWGQYIKPCHRLMITPCVVLGYLHGLQLFESSFLFNLIIAFVSIMFEMPHVGDVAHVAHFITKMLQISEEQIKGDGRTRMT